MFQTNRFTAFLVLVCLVFPFEVLAGNVISNVPSNPNIENKYIFFLHGSTEENDGATDKYQMMLDAIADSSAIVISELRGYTNPNDYALKIKDKVDQLIAKGVQAKNITVGGYSKGAIITLAASGFINNTSINYVLLAGCSEFLNSKYNIQPSKAVGRILSIYDSGDEKFESCDGIISSSQKVIFEETDLDSGKGHKVFRIPKDKFIELWRDPLIDWAGA